LAPVALEHELVISHGNGPQVGLLALQASAYDPASAYPFDVLGAQTEGMIGYLIEQELGNLLPFEKPLATILTMTEWTQMTLRSAGKTKFDGAGLLRGGGARLADQRGWSVRRDGQMWRRVVPSPVSPEDLRDPPHRMAAATHGCVVICAGGGGIPTTYLKGTRKLVGVEAVIDKDRASAVLAQGLRADLLVIATDVDAVYLDWGTSSQRAVVAAHPDDIREMDLPAGSMGPKAEAAAAFASGTGRPCVIGALDQLPAILAGTSGTRIAVDVTGLHVRASRPV
jgi:carbamate kinase